MKTLQFKCKLLSDVILNQRAATEGNQESLTFIPGNCFLGIVAKDYMNFQPQEQAEIFHSGHVRFGDAHPASKDAKTRSLHIPASLFYPKLKSLSEEATSTTSIAAQMTSMVLMASHSSSNNAAKATMSLQRTRLTQ